MNIEIKTKTQTKNKKQIHTGDEIKGVVDYGFF